MGMRLLLHQDFSKRRGVMDEAEILYYSAFAF
jgi:hypothetical protein